MTRWLPILVALSPLATLGCAANFHDYVVSVASEKLSCPKDQLELTQVPPRVAVGHVQLRRRLAQRSPLLDQLEEARAASAELQPLPEGHPHPELGLHGT